MRGLQAIDDTLHVCREGRGVRLRCEGRRANQVSREAIDQAGHNPVLVALQGRVHERLVVVRAPLQTERRCRDEKRAERRLKAWWQHAQIPQCRYVEHGHKAEVLRVVPILIDEEDVAAAIARSRRRHVYKVRTEWSVDILEEESLRGGRRLNERERLTHGAQRGYFPVHAAWARLRAVDRSVEARLVRLIVNHHGAVSRPRRTSHDPADAVKDVNVLGRHDDARTRRLRPAGGIPYVGFSEDGQPMQRVFRAV